MTHFYTLAVGILVFSSRWALSVSDVGVFTPCLHFFYRSQPPKGLAGTPVCQRYNNQYRFATLYSRQRRSPWFSAYLYTVPTGKRQEVPWMYEPQLANQRADGNMMPFPPPPLDQNVVESQAVLQDYNDSTYSRGHLNPSLHHHQQEDRSSTFTLTNVVPQKEASNAGPWTRLEQSVDKILKDYCLGQAFIVTGIIPYQKDEQWLRNRVAVPEYIWSAYCCPNFKNNLPKYLQNALPTYAAIGRNDPNSSEEIVPVSKQAKKQYRGYDVKRMSLAELEKNLKDRFNTVVSVFDEQCSG